MRRLGITIGLLLAIAASAHPVARQASRDDARLDRLSAVITAQMKELGVPGVALGVLENGVVSTRTFGVTNVDHPLPVTDATLFQIGSISKTFTGTLMMLLVEQGHVNLLAPIVTYVPTFAVKDPVATKRASVRDTLTHMGGWEGDLFVDEGLGDDALKRGVARMSTLEQVAPAGKVWGYNNAGFYVAGRVIEVATKKTYEQALGELVIKPLGLTNTFIMPTDALTRRYAVGHDGLPPRVIGPWHIGRVAHPAGGVFTDIRDLLKYARFHLGSGTADDGTRVLSQTSLAQMHKAVAPKLGSSDAMAITWHVTKPGNTEVLFHAGGTNGQISYLALVPSKQLAIALLTNASAGSPLNTEVFKAALREYAGVTIVDPVARDGSAAERLAFVGTWRRQFQDVVISANGNALTLQVVPRMAALNGTVPPAGPPAPVSLASGGGLMFTAGARAGTRIDAVPQDDGSIGWLRVGSRIHRRVPSAK